MPKKNTLLSYPTLSGANMASAAVTSSVTNIQHLDDIGYQFNWTGSATGNFQIQVSADYAQDYSSPGNVTNNGNWTPLLFTYWDGSAFVTSNNLPTSSGSPIYVDLALLSAPWIRAVYTKTGGTGSLTATITAKEVG